MTTPLAPSQLNVLLTNHLFAGVDSQWLEHALQDPRCQHRRHNRGSVIYGGRQFERALGVLLSGRIRVTRTNHDGRQMLVSMQQPGAVFGMAVLFCDAETFATELHCETNCTVLYVPEALLLEWMRQQFQLAENYIRYLSDRILFLNSKIAGLSAGDCVHKLAQWLLEHHREQVADLPPLSRLASELNISRASLYRALDALTQAGIVRREDRRLVILSPARLQGLRHDDTLD